MKRIHFKILLLLMLPIIILAGLAVRKGVPQTVITDINVLTYSPQERKKRSMGNSDTVVKIILDSNASAIYKYGFYRYKMLKEGSAWKLPRIIGYGYLVDEQGNKYQRFQYEGDNIKGVLFGWEYRLEDQQVRGIFSFPLTQIPASAGKITLVGEIYIGASRFPVSVTVRDQKHI